MSRYRESVRRDMTTEALAKDRMSKEKLYIKAQEALRVCTEWAEGQQNWAKRERVRKVRVSRERKSEQRERVRE